MAESDGTPKVQRSTFSDTPGSEEYVQLCQVLLELVFRFFCLNTRN